MILFSLSLTMVFGKGVFLLFGATGSWALLLVPAFEQTLANITVPSPTMTHIAPDTQMSLSDPSLLPLRLQSVIEDFQDHLASVETPGEKEPGEVRLVNSEPILETEDEGNFTVVPPPRPASAPGRVGLC
jgi:hypothetical protein